MYSKIVDSHSDVFDGETGDYMGHSYFTLTENSERKLLDLLNYNRSPDSLMLLNVNLSEPSKNYIPPELFQKRSRMSVLSIDAVDSYSKKLVPFEIRLRYDVVARGSLSEDPYFFESLELENIEIMDVNYRHI